MIFKIAGRRGGKTYAIHKLMEADPNAIMITHSHLLASYAVRDHPSLRGRVFGMEEFDRLQGRQISKVHIDNLDMILQSLLPVGERIGLVTATGAIFREGFDDGSD